MRLKTLAVLLLATAVVAAPASAQQTARNLWWLCHIDDPSCVPDFVRLIIDIREHPSAVGCALGNSDSTCGPMGHAYTATCRLKMTMQPEQIFYMWSDYVRDTPLLQEEPAKVGVIEALRMLNQCGG
jgi:hypothetical protein